jgi:HPt (histidine-containing phosphotransfer) domain-containing protein
MAAGSGVLSFFTGRFGRQHDRRLDFHTPIIGLTARHTEGKIDTLRQPGMNEIIAKPITVASLRKTLERCTKVEAPSAASRPSPDTSAVCNLEAALAQLDDDHELFNEMIVLFLEEYPQSLAKMNQAVTDNDPQALTYSAHALRGALSHFHATGAMTLALQLEQCGRKGDLSQVTPLLTELENLLPRVASILVNTQVTIAA